MKFRETDQQYREAFKDEFYRIACAEVPGFYREEDEACPAPWGQPWIWGGYRKCGKDPRKEAAEYLERHYARMTLPGDARGNICEIGEKLTVFPGRN